MVIRHFTATGYLIWDRGVFLHRHPKIGLWLPPGGHVEINEDPVEAVLREIKEETGLVASICEEPPFENMNFDYPIPITPPRHILEEHIDDPIVGFHHHIDMIYYCKPIDTIEALHQGWKLFSDVELKKTLELYYQQKDTFDSSLYPPLDVLTLGIKAIEATS